MSLLKCVRAALLAVIPAAAVACTSDSALPTGPAAQPAAAVTQPTGDRASATFQKQRSGYVLASGRNGSAGARD